MTELTNVQKHARACTEHLQHVNPTKHDFGQMVALYFDEVFDCYCVEWTCGVTELCKFIG